MSKPLLSDVSFVRLSLAESTGDRVKVKGEFAKCGVATENKRVYPKHVWEKEIKRLNKALKERRVFGEVDHPSDGQTKLARVSHIITELGVKDGLIIGEAEIMPTESGRNLLALLKANVPVGVSSRGFGSVKTNESGVDVVQDDYKLVTFDFVADPADVDAYPQVSESRSLFEGVEFDADAEQEQAIEFARRIEAEKQAKKPHSPDVREEFAGTILQSLASLRAEVRDEVRKELLGDPEIGRAKTALEAVRTVLLPFLLPEDAAAVVSKKDAEIQELQDRLVEKELRIKALEEENSSLAGVAKEVGYRFYLERSLSGEPDAEAIRDLVGDVKLFPNSDALKEKVAAVKRQLARQAEERREAAEQKAKAIAEARQAERKVRDAIEAKLSKLEEMVEDERSRREELEEKLILAEKERNDLTTKVYAESRLKNHPKAGRLRGLVEAVRPNAPREVDEILESAREPITDSDDAQSVRARIRTRMNGGREHVPAELTESTSATPRRAGGENYHGLGTSLEVLKRLSGIDH